MPVAPARPARRFRPGLDLTAFSPGDVMRGAAAWAVSLDERWKSGATYNPLSARTAQHSYPV